MSCFQDQTYVAVKTDRWWRFCWTENVASWTPNCFLLSIFVRDWLNEWAASALDKSSIWMKPFRGLRKAFTFITKPRMNSTNSCERWDWCSYTNCMSALNKRLVNLIISWTEPYVTPSKLLLFQLVMMSRQMRQQCFCFHSAVDVWHHKQKGHHEQPFVKLRWGRFEVSSVQTKTSHAYFSVWQR